MNGTYNGQSNGISIGKLIGNGLIIIGILFMLAGIGITVFLSSLEKDTPDDAKWYKAVVSEVVSVKEQVKKVESSNKIYRDEITYDCDILLEYEVDGEKQKISYFVDGSQDLLDEGDVYYVKVSPSNPTKIYVFSKEPDDSFIEIGLIFIAVVGLITVIVGIVVKKLAKIAKVVDRPTSIM